MEAGQFPLWLTLLQNHESKTAELLLTFSNVADRTAWAESLAPPTSKVILGASEVTANIYCNCVHLYWKVG